MKINKKYLIIVIVIILLIIALFLIFRKDKTDEHKYNGWRSNIERNSYMNVTDFGNNKCNKKYYSPTFHIDDDNILYDYNDNKIDEGIFSIHLITYGNCELQMIFVTTLNGQLYYVNNLVDSEYKKYQFVEIEEVPNIASISVDDENNIVAVDYLGSESTINEKIDTYLNINYDQD